MYALDNRHLNAIRGCQSIAIRPREEDIATHEKSRGVVVSRHPSGRDRGRGQGAQVEEIRPGTGRGAAGRNE